MYKKFGLELGPDDPYSKLSVKPHSKAAFFCDYDATADSTRDVDVDVDVCDAATRSTCDAATLRVAASPTCSTTVEREIQALNSMGDDDDRSKASWEEEKGLDDPPPPPDRPMDDEIPFTPEELKQRSQRSLRICIKCW